MTASLHDSPSQPAPGAAQEEWRRFRALHRRLDRRARRELRGLHPAIWRAAAPERAVCEAAMAASAGEILKPGPGSQVRRLRLPDGSSVVVKHYPPTRALDPRDAIGWSKAVRSFLAAEALARRGFGVARPLAAWSRPGQGSWLLLEDLAAAQPFHEAAARRHGRERAALLAAVAAEVRQLHRAGVAYRDLKPSNLLIGGDASAPRPFFVDHDRNWFLGGEVPRLLARRDLAALHAGLPPEVRAAERLAALRAYDPGWLAGARWRRDVRALLREAARRAHRWVPRRLLAGP